MPEEPWQGLPPPGVLEPLPEVAGKAGRRAPEPPPPLRVLPGPSRLRRLARPVLALAAACVLIVVVAQAHALMYGRASAEQVLLKVAARLKAAQTLKATAEIAPPGERPIALTAVEERPARLRVKMEGGPVGGERVALWDGDAGYLYLPFANLYARTVAPFPAGGAAGLAGVTPQGLERIARLGQARKLRARRVEGVPCYAIEITSAGRRGVLFVPMSSLRFVRLDSTLPMVGAMSGRLEFDPLLDPGEAVFSPPGSATMLPLADLR